jgi:putative transposase
VGRFDPGRLSRIPGRHVHLSLQVSSAGQAGLDQRIKEICQTRVRYGYRCVHVLLRREGWGINQKKTRRVYRELGLQLRNKTPKRRVKAKLREDRRNATRPDETWAMDFVHDQLATGRKLRVLTIVDTFSRFSPALEPRFSFRGGDVVEVLERVGREIGLPAAIRVDQGTEFVSRDLDLWAYQRGVTLDFSRPGKQTDNAFIEAFNGRFRAECLNAHWFLTLADAKEKMEERVSTTMKSAPTGRSAKSRRLRCSITLAQPARHRQNSRKTLPAGDPKMGLSAWPRFHASHLLSGRPCPVNSGGISQLAGPLHEA